MASCHSSRRAGFSSSNFRDSMLNKQKLTVIGIEETLEDCISQLPDALIVQILSLLPTKDAVTSCVLSKRFRYLWISIEDFLFVAKDFKNVRDFISFVDQVLPHCTCSKIKKFQLDLTGIPELDIDLKISEWLSFAADKKVEDVVLYSHDEDLIYELPLSMCTCSSLIALDLSCWWFDKEFVIAWNSLKCLKLQSIELDNDDIVKLLSCCPALETLELSSFEGFQRLEITSSNLKKVKLKYCPYFEETGAGLEIVAPYLQHLELTGDLGYLKCRLINVSSLVTANLTFNIGCFTDVLDEDEIGEDSCRDYHQAFRNLVLDYLQKLSSVTELIIGTWLSKVVFMMQLERMPLPELRIKCLTLELHVTKYNVYGVASLLQTLPLLESLNIHLQHGFMEHCQHEISYLVQADNTNFLSWTPDIVFPNLKNVKIVGCLPECWKNWSKGDFFKLPELSKFVLKNAVVLKKFVIVAKKRICGECSECCVSQYLSRMAMELLGSPRSSRRLKMIYQEYD